MAKLNSSRRQLDFFAVIGVLGIILAAGGIGSIFPRSPQTSTPKTPDLKSCLNVLESSVNSYQIALAQIPQEPDKITDKHFLNAQKALNTLQTAYDASCQNINQKEVKSLNKSVKAIATILGNFPADTNKQDSPTIKAITNIQNALNQKGYTIDVRKGRGGKFRPATKTQLQKYLNISSITLTEIFREIQLANIPVYLDEMNQKIETQNQHLWWLTVGVLSGVALPFLFAKHLTQKYQKSQQEVLKQFTAITVALKRNSASSPISSPPSVSRSHQDDLLRQATKGSRN